MNGIGGTGKQKWVVAKYVAVQFKVGNRYLWTNFSRDGEQWLWTGPEMRKYLGQKTTPANEDEMRKYLDRCAVRSPA